MANLIRLSERKKRQAEEEDILTEGSFATYLINS